MIFFEQIANKKWISAQQISNVFIGNGRQEGKEYLFKNPFTLRTSYGSFRFIPEKQVFMDMTQSGEDIHVTPEKFISKLLQITEKEAWRLIKQSSGEWINCNQYAPQKQTQHQKPVEKARKEFSLDDGLKNESYLTRLAIFSDLIGQLNQVGSTQKRYSNRVLNFFNNRAYDVELILTYKDLFQLYDLNTVQCFRKKFSNEQFIQSGLVKLNLHFYWLGSDYSLFFPCWYPYFIKNLNETHWFVTGIRLRYTPETNQIKNNKEYEEDIEPYKDVEIPLPDELKKLEFPSAVGWYGLKYWANIYPTVLNKCENLNVIIVEGVTDMMAAMEIITADNTIILTTGILARFFHSINIDLISKCKTLFIAFDDDSSAKSNTGQKNAAALKKHLNTMGMNNVEILPKHFYQGQKDFNDLLRFIKNKKDHLQNGLSKGA